MKILSLNIQNIRGIKSINIEPKGENIIIFGPNGTGKSAVVDAIDFLLTGEISRLTGEGTKGISLKKHGCHIDSREKLDNTIVNAIIEIDDKEISIQRSINKPSVLKVGPESLKPFVNDCLQTASLGLHILSRRDILKYVTSEAGKRSTEILSLLNLHGIQSTRSTLVSVKNKAKRECRNA